MAYEKQNFVDGDVLAAAPLNAMDDQIAENEKKAGKKLDAHAEIFNDYDGNETNIPYGHIEGANNKAVLRGFRITGLSGTKGMIGGKERYAVLDMTLDSVEGIEPGDLVNMFIREGDGLSKIRDRVVSVNAADSSVRFEFTSTYYEITWAFDTGFLTLVEGDTTDFTNGQYLIVQKVDENRDQIGTTVLTVPEEDQKHFSVHVSGVDNRAGVWADVSGIGNISLGVASSATGWYHKVFADRGHATGYKNTVMGYEGTAEGSQNLEEAWVGHAEGWKTIVRPHARAGHSQGWGTIAAAEAQHAAGTYNIEDTEQKYLEVIGNGTDDEHRSNARTLDRQGNAWFAGEVVDGHGNRLSDVATVEDVLAALPTWTGGSY